MAKQDLNQLITWLQAKGTNRFEIHDVDAEASIEKCISYSDIARTHGDVESYFESLMNKGVKVVQVQKKTKNGSTFKRVGCGLNFALSNDNEEFVAASGSTGNAGVTQQFNQAPAQQAASPDVSGLMGAAAGMGLSMPQFMAMSNQAERYKDSEKTARELQDQVKTLTAENKELEKENLKHELGIQARPSAADKALDMIASNPDLITSFLPLLMGNKNGKAPQASLSSPAPELTPSKGTLVDWLSNKPEVTEQHAEVCRYILMQSLTGNQSFIDELNDLITKDQLPETA